MASQSRVQNTTNLSTPTSMPIVISASRAIQQSNAAAVQAAKAAIDMINPLVSIKALMSGHGFCSFCWLINEDTAHQAQDCRRVTDWDASGGQFRRWKSALQLLMRHCFTCALQQASSKLFT
jgi:hypothetical protein